ALADGPANWARTAAGAVIVPSGDGGAGCGSRAALLDGDASTGWSGQAGASATIALPTAIDVSSIDADPGAVCGDPAGAAASAYELATSADGVTFVPWPGAAQGVRYVRVTLLAASDPGAGSVDLAGLEVIGTTSPLRGPDTVTAATTTAAATTTTAAAPPPATAKPPATPKRATTTKGAKAPAPGPKAAVSTHFTGGTKVSVTCAAACTSRMALTLSAHTRARLHTKVKQAFSHTFRLRKGTWQVTVSVSKHVRSLARHHHVRTLRFSLSTVTSAGATGTATATRTVNLRAY
ncbi:MAG TPA: discoidin domain-containing protein, partial [Solirubrobacteraceae bacterium]|nr:discoidin domain-containing protein [Solirubrobacteraceae bacterium]